MMPKKVLFAIVGTSLLSLFAGASAGYYFAQRVQTERAAAAIYGSMTGMYVGMERKEIELLSQILSYKDNEYAAEKRKTLCALIGIKLNSINYHQQRYKQLYSSYSELKKTSVVSESVSSDIELSKLAVERAACAKN